MNAQPVFELRGVGFEYPGGQAALAGVDLCVHGAERVALLGANASGKSTLLCLLDGLYFPTTGDISAFGQPLTEAALEGGRFSREFRQRVGFLFQNTDAQLFNATVEEELAFAPLQLQLPAEQVRGRVEDMLDLLGMEALRERSPLSLSGGEKKRVALGALLTASPSVLLLDEPTAGLDPRSQQWLLELLCELEQRGVTVIAATHDLEFAPEVAERALVISESHQIVADGPINTVLQDVELLGRVNLIHTHTHMHAATAHAHPHLHGLRHEHYHGQTGGSP